MQSRSDKVGMCDINVNKTFTQRNTFATNPTSVRQFLFSFILHRGAFYNNNNNMLFMVPHLIRVWNTYKDISIHSFHHTHTQKFMHYG